MTEEGAPQRGLFRRSSERSICRDEAKQGGGLKGGLGAFRQRGWLRLECRKFENPHPLLPSQQAYVLDADGRARLEGLERKLADEQPSAKVRRAGKWLGLKVRDVVFMAFGALLLELLKRLL